MSDASGNSSDGGLPEQPAGLPAQSSAQTPQRWTGSKTLKVIWTLLAAFLVAIFGVGAIVAGTPAEAIILPIVVTPLAVAGCYRLWRSSVELTGDGTLIVATLLRTYHIPVARIFGLRWGEHGLRITLIDGRIVTSSVLLTGLRRRRPPDQAADAISAITQAIDAARSAQPAAIEAAIDAGAPLRAKRAMRRRVVWTAVGPAMLIASFFVPAAGSDLDWRLRWAGIAYTLVSLRIAYSLLRVARQSAGRAYRRPGRR
jgi:hypothetical protein